MSFYDVMSSTDFVEELRSSIPILSTQVHGYPLTYLDNAATTQKPLCVLKAMDDYYREANSNVHRSIHYLSNRSTALLEEARSYVQKFLSAPSSREIIFTKGTTESINLVAHSWGERLSLGDEILLSAMEHHSNLVPWQLLAQRKGLKLREIPLQNGSEEIDIEAFKEMLSPRTKLVSLVHMSNALGRINPVEEMIKMAHQVGAKVLLDGAQAVAHLAVDVAALNTDFYAFSSHKVYGPMGVGVLYGKASLLEEMPPYQGGGEMIQKVQFHQSTFNEIPQKFEAGTPNVGGIIGLRRALEWIQDIGYETVEAQESSLLKYCTEALLSLPGLRLFAAKGNKGPICSFTIEGIHDFDVGQLLDAKGIALRTGHHCTQPLMDFLGIEGTMRVSFAIYNSKEEVQHFMNTLVKITKTLR